MCLFTNRSCYSACIRVLPLYPFDLPSFSSQPRKVTICGRHEMASVQHIKIDEALLVLCLAYYAMKWVRHCRNWDAMAFTYRNMGRTFHEYILRILRNGWMDCRDAFHAALCLYCCVTDKTYLNMKRTGLWASNNKSLGHAFHERILRIFCYGGMDCRDTFHACVTNTTKLSTKQTGLSVFQ